MSISTFFNSYTGMYITQAVFHSLVATLIADRALVIWNIGNPRIKQRFSLIAIIFPLFSFPLYQLINPDRGSLSFRLDTLFDSHRWFNLNIAGKFPLGILFISLLVITALVFFFQELLPVLKHLKEAKEAFPEGEKPGSESIVARAVEGLCDEPPDIYIFDEEPFLFSRTGSRASIYVSTGLTEKLTLEELRASIAHEIAHIRRNKRPLLTVVFLLRVLMFFNPVVLFEFRRAVHEEEKICDDIAVSMTGKPEVLAEALRKFHPEHGSDDSDEMPQDGRSIIEHGHNLLLESRIRRLEKDYRQDQKSGWAVFVLVILFVTAVNYFVV
jgi:Zn-dependent protease with chaperone function